MAHPHQDTNVPNTCTHRITSKKKISQKTKELIRLVPRPLLLGLKKALYPSKFGHTSEHEPWYFRTVYGTTNVVQPTFQVSWSFYHDDVGRRPRTRRSATVVEERKKTHSPIVDDARSQEGVNVVDRFVLVKASFQSLPARQQNLRNNLKKRRYLFSLLRFVCVFCWRQKVAMGCFAIFGG